MFGYRISLNFERKGDTHKTLVSGLISLIGRIVIAAYTWFVVSRMLKFENDEYKTITKVVDLFKMEETVQGKELENLFFYYITSDSMSSFELRVKYAKYLDMYLEATHYDWY